MSGETDGTGTDGEPQGRPRVRASDADRHAVVHRLQEAVARGQLSFDEGSERMARAWAGRYQDELPELTADLPVPAPAPETAPGWQALGLLALLQLRTTLGGAAGPASRAARARLAAVSVAALLFLGLVLGLVVSGLAAHGPDAGAFAGPHGHR
jgi:Domain of unknown function (DUF1707)